MTQDMKTLSARWIEEIWNQGNLDAVDEIIAPDYVNHNAPPGVMQGPEGYKQMVQMVRSPFPDFYMTVEDVIAEGDKIAVRWTMRGTHQGDLMGIAATGKQVTISGIDIARIEDGKVVEEWQMVDQVGLMQQLGVSPG